MREHCVFLSKCRIIIIKIYNASKSCSNLVGIEKTTQSKNTSLMGFEAHILCIAFCYNMHAREKIKEYKNY
ncbi:MAG: hypothetical protein RLZZ144_830 [Pseudomonadota bacterium]